MAPKQQQNKGVIQVFPQEMRSLRQKKKIYIIIQPATDGAIMLWCVHIQGKIINEI